MFPHDADERQITFEIAWCPGCRADCTVEIVTVDDDPFPVAVCVDCGLGVEIYWSAGVVEPSRPGIAKAS